MLKYELFTIKRIDLSYFYIVDKYYFVYIHKQK